MALLKCLWPFFKLITVENFDVLPEYKKKLLESYNEYWFFRCQQDTGKPWQQQVNHKYKTERAYLGKHKRLFKTRTRLYFNLLAKVWLWPVLRNNRDKWSSLCLCDKGGSHRPCTDWPVWSGQPALGGTVHQLWSGDHGPASKEYRIQNLYCLWTVSYTHLTLPTSSYV